MKSLCRCRNHGFSLSLVLDNLGLINMLLVKEKLYFPANHRKKELNPCLGAVQRSDLAGVESFMVFTYVRVLYGHQQCVLILPRSIAQPHQQQNLAVCRE